MELIVGIFYFSLFLFSLIKRRYAIFFLPLFLFCYPNNLQYINTGSGFGLDDIYIISIYMQTLFFRKNYENHLMSKFRRLVLFMVFIFLFSNIVGYWADGFVNFQAFSLFKATLLFSYAYMICCIYSNLEKFNVNIKELKSSIVFSVFFQALIAICVFHFTKRFLFFYDSTDILLSGDVAFRAVGSMKGPWELGGFLAIGYVLLFTEFARYKLNSKAYNTFVIFAFVMVTYAIVLTQSRASWLFVALSTIYMLRKGGIKQLAMILFVAIVVVILFYDYLNPVFDLVTHRINYTTHYNSGDLDNSSEARLLIWGKILDSFNFAYILTGYGVRNFNEAFGYTPHNNYISIIAYNGLIGLVTYSYFIYFIYRYGRESNLKQVSFNIKAILVGLFIYSFTTDTLYTNEVFKLLLIVSILAIKQHTDFKKSSREYLIDNRLARRHPVFFQYRTFKRRL